MEMYIGNTCGSICNCGKERECQATFERLHFILPYSKGVGEGHLCVKGIMDRESSLSGMNSPHFKGK